MCNRKDTVVWRPSLKLFVPPDVLFDETLERHWSCRLVLPFQVAVQLVQCSNEIPADQSTSICQHIACTDLTIAVQQVFRVIALAQIWHFDTLETFFTCEIHAVSQTGNLCRHRTQTLSLFSEVSFPGTWLMVFQHQRTSFPACF